MSREIQDMFETSLKQALREERRSAEQWRQEAGNIDVAHLLCSCGEPFKEKLLTDLLIASSNSFENFMLYLCPEHFSESQREVAIMKELANVRKQHLSVLLLEYLANSTDRIFTVKDIIDGLEFANLFRVIAGFRHQSLQALKEHASSSRHTVCCQARSRIAFSPRGTSRHIELRGLPLPSGSSGSCKNKAFRGIVLLTFMNDGRHHAMQVKNMLENYSGRSKRPYIVFTLSNFSQHIIENFMKHIVWIMSQVDFVVPILTDHYFQLLTDERETSGSGVDEKYAPYVVQLLLAEWASNFRNKRLRSFKPRGVKPPSKAIYPPFEGYVEELSELPSILIKSKD